MEPIREFKDEFEFLSNFFPAPILWRGEVWPTSEHLFQGAKTNDQSEKKFIRHAQFPGQAKKIGRTVTKRPDWEDVKVQVMERVLWEKFTQNPELGEKLLATGDRELVEGTWWNDRFWGVDLKQDPPVGENWLGRLLMLTRAKLWFQCELQQLAKEVQTSRWGFSGAEILGVAQFVGLKNLQCGTVT